MTDTHTATAKKDVATLQRIVVDALEDVKAADLVLFNTEHLSSLFERVVIASGTSNRQTRALAASVRDQVRDAGFGKPRIEGEENGEWIVVDCGSVVVHVMQPAIRAYYHLEDIWGDTPVRLKPVAVEKAMAKREKIADLKKNSPLVAEFIESDAPKRVVAKSAKKAVPVAEVKSAPAKSSRRPAPTKADVAAKKAAVKRAVKAAAPKPAPQVVPKVKHVSATKPAIKAALQAGRAEMEQKATGTRKAAPKPTVRAAVPARKAVGVKRAGPIKKPASN